MNPGRELDVLVAEKVMNLTEQYSYQINKFGVLRNYYRIALRVDDPEIQGSFDGKHWTPVLSKESGFIVAPYSTDISAAWEVVEKIIKQGKHINIAYYQDYAGIDGPSYKAHWSVSGFFNQQTHEDNGNAQTAPHAICEAALKAVGAF